MQREGRERLPVLVVDGHPIVADAIGGVLVDLDSRLDVTVCHSAVGAIDAFRRVPTWFRILVDLEMPRGGLALARQFHASGIADRCAIVTAVVDRRGEAPRHDRVRRQGCTARRVLRRIAVDTRRAPCVSGNRGGHAVDGAPAGCSAVALRGVFDEGNRGDAESGHRHGRQSHCERDADTGCEESHTRHYAGTRARDDRCMRR